jgi:hypothetical protein
MVHIQVSVHVGDDEIGLEVLLCHSSGEIRHRNRVEFLIRKAQEARLSDAQAFASGNGIRTIVLLCAPGPHDAIRENNYRDIPTARNKLSDRSACTQGFVISVRDQDQSIHT